MASLRFKPTPLPTVGGDKTRPWYVRYSWAVLTISLAVVGLLVLVEGGFGREDLSRTERQELRTLRDKVAHLSQENIKLSEKLVQSQQKSEIERSTQARLGSEISQLQQHNLSLKEEILALQESFGGKGSAPLRIQKLRLEKLTDQSYRYVLIVLQGGTKAAQNLSVRLKFYAQGVNTPIVTSHTLEVKNYQVVEGRISSEAAIPRFVSASVDVLSGKEVKASKVFNLK